MRRRGGQSARRARNTITTRSGKTIRINNSLGDRAKARKSAQAAAKAAYLSTLPKNRFKRVLYRMHPKRVAQYWFSRQGGIMALKIIGMSIVIGFFLTIGLFAFFRKDLPKIKDLSGDSKGGNTIYYDRTGQTVLFNDYNSVKRLPIKSEEMSPYIKKATVAIEDKDFYKHGAFDVRGISRAIVHDVTGKTGRIQGGSTITQQLVKLDQDWTNNRTITRKVKELILAVELEREYSKDDVLTGYLNLAPYGGSLYGVEAAARDYFHVSAKDLTLAQAAMLAAIPQAPSFYSPYAGNRFNPAVTGDTFDPEAMIGRQHYIIDQMLKQRLIKKQEADEAKNVDILAQVHPQDDKYKNIKAPYFVLAARNQLEQIYGDSTVQRGGWKVTTTLDLRLQDKAEQIIAANQPHVLRNKGNQQALVAEDVQTGQIVSLVGGTDFSNKEYGENNYAAGFLIPPGSSFKPYDYAAVIDNNNNVGAGSVFYDTQAPIPGYPCTIKTNPKTDKKANCLYDYDFKFPGPVTLRYALGGSRNVPAVKAMLSTVPNDKSNGRVDSINKTIQTASDMMYNTYNKSKKRSSYNCYADEALTKTTQCYGAAAIGDGAFLRLDDHVNGLATLARMGTAIPRTYLLKITDGAGKNVALPIVKPVQAIKPDTAYIVNNMSSDPSASYLPGSCTETNCTALNRGGFKFHRFNGWHFGIKTGTTNDNYDGLMTAWSSKYAVVTWAGHHSRQVELNRISMERLTAPIARPWMEFAHTDVKPVNWTPPNTIKTGPAFIVRTHIGLGSREPSPANDLYPGWYAGGGNTKSSSQTIDRVSGKVATSCTPAAAKTTAANSNANFWNVDPFNGGKQSVANSNSTGTAAPQATDDVHNCNDSKPTVTVTAPATCNSSCVITATVSQGTHPLTDAQRPQFPSTVNFTLGGQTINTQRVSTSPHTVSFTYTPTANGSGPLTATVTDSVLYSGSDSVTLNYSAPPQAVSLSAFSAKIFGSGITFSWAGGAPVYNVTRSDNGLPLCTTSNTTCASSTSNAPPGTPVTLKDSAGNTAQTNTGP